MSNLFNTKKFQVHKHVHSSRKHRKNVRRAKKALSILVADHHQSTRQVYSASFRLRGHSVIQVKTAADAMAALHEQTFHIVLVEASLAPIQNEHVVHAVKKLHPKAVVLLLGSFDKGDQIVKELHDGADYYLDRSQVNGMDVVEVAESLMG